MFLFAFLKCFLFIITVVGSSSEIINIVPANFILKSIMAHTLQFVGGHYRPY